MMCVRAEPDLDHAETSQQALGSPGLFQVIKCCRHAGFRINYISLSGLFKGSESSVELKIEFLKVTFLSSRWSISEVSVLHPGSAQPETRERCWSLNRVEYENTMQKLRRNHYNIHYKKICAVKGQRSKGSFKGIMARYGFSLALNSE